MRLLPGDSTHAFTCHYPHCIRYIVAQHSSMPRSANDLQRYHIGWFQVVVLQAHSRPALQKLCNAFFQDCAPWLRHTKTKKQRHSVLRCSDQAKRNSHFECFGSLAFFSLQGSSAQRASVNLFPCWILSKL